MSASCALEALFPKTSMQLKMKIVLLAGMPLVVSVVLIALGVRQQLSDIGASQRQLVERVHVAAQQARRHDTGLPPGTTEAILREFDQQAEAGLARALLLIAGVAVFGVALVGACAVIVSLSEHRIAYGKLQLLARQLVRSQEEERAYLSRELHDGTSQTLVSIKLLVEAAIEHLDARPGAGPPRPLSKALARLNDALTEVRRMSHRLRPALLDTLGLCAALRHLGEEFGDHSGVAFTFVHEGREVELGDDVKTMFFRLAQEALTNIEKHAGASRVRMRLAFCAEAVELEIQDDGQGFDLASVQEHPSRGIGLRNMRERMQSIGGRCVITSRPRRTVVRARVPLDALERYEKWERTEHA